MTVLRCACGVYTLGGFDDTRTIAGEDHDRTSCDQPLPGTTEDTP